MFTPSRLRLVSIVVGGLVFLIAAAALIGWSLNNDTLKQIIPTGVPMSPTVGVCAILLALALIVPRAATNMKYVRRTAGLFVLAVAVIKLFDIMAGTDSRVDQHIMTARISASDPFYKNPMAPTTALGLLLLSASALCLDAWNRRIALAGSVAAGGAGIMAAVALVGFISGVQSLYDPIGYYPMALNSAIVTLTLAAGFGCRARGREIGG